jgi:hypothetical protein
VSTPYEEFRLEEAVTDVGDTYGYYLVHDGCPGDLVRRLTETRWLDNLTTAQQIAEADRHWRATHGGES